VPLFFDTSFFCFFLRFRSRAFSFVLFASSSALPSPSFSCSAASSISTEAGDTSPVSLSAVSLDARRFILMRAQDAADAPVAVSKNTTQNLGGSAHGS